MSLFNRVFLIVITCICKYSPRNRSSMEYLVHWLVDKKKNQSRLKIFHSLLFNYCKSSAYRLKARKDFYRIMTWSHFIPSHLKDCVVSSPPTLSQTCWGTILSLAPTVWNILYIITPLCLARSLSMLQSKPCDTLKKCVCMSSYIFLQNFILT